MVNNEIIKMILRDYQQDLKARIYSAWAAGHNDVLAVLATGGGKTPLFSSIVHEEPGASVAIAHRQELVSQMSLTLARWGVHHRVIGSKALIKDCVALHMVELGASFYSPRARCAAAGVDTLIKLDPSDPWRHQVRKRITDEGHHLLRDNKWGKAAALFPNARGLAVTATPTRADGRGLGRHADGLIDLMVEGPAMRELIERGFLADYRIFAPPSDLDLTTVPLSAGGDYSPPKVSEAVHKSRITGDIVTQYLKIAAGKRGITFAVDVPAAREIEAAFKAQGVPAAMVTADSGAMVRSAVMRDLREGRLLQVVNVDLLGEGVDVPAVEVVSMGRPTASYGLFVQQFGRPLRPSPGKSHGLIIDHVGNVLRHGLPDRPRVWTLDRRERASRGAPSDVVPVRTCGACTAVYERIYRGCPFCGEYPEPAGRSGPEQVDGDLAELTPDVLARLRGDVARVDGSPLFPAGLPQAALQAIANRHYDRKQAQGELRAAMQLWGGWRQYEGLELHEAHRLFFLRFGVDVATAQTLGAKDAEALRGRVLSDCK